jgi:outer membrane receptor protein involved in Fe transport
MLRFQLPARARAACASRFFPLALMTLLLLVAGSHCLVSMPCQQAQGKPGTGQQPGQAQIPNEVIVVTAPRIDIPLNETPAATTVIPIEVLQVMPRGIGAEEALKAVPGVKIDNQADGVRVHISIRGQGLLTERGIRGIKVLFDGLPLNDPTGFAPDLFNVDWLNVQNIGVFRGPASALYGGGAAGGVIDIKTAAGGSKPITADGSFTYGSNNFYKAYAQIGGK